MALRISLNTLSVLFRRDLGALNKNHLRHVTSSITSNSFRPPTVGAVAKVSRNNKIDNEENFYVAQNDPDVFGQKVAHKSDTEVDPGDIKEESYIQNVPRRSRKLEPTEYANMIKSSLENNRIKEAIDILEVRMKEDRVKPGKYIFNLLISGCARAGYSKKAFQLYNKMKQSGIPVTSGTYTSLFNACATDPWPEVGLARANRLREIMLEKGYIPNAKNYNAIIKAYGRCGDVKTAFQMVDEMLEKNLQIATDTFNFLLQACASDEEHGFRHALITWNKMLKKNLRPDIYSFNLMLRCTRDCSIGDVETMNEAIAQIIGPGYQQLGDSDEMTQSSFNDSHNSKTCSQISDCNVKIEEVSEHKTSEVQEINTNCENSVASLQSPSAIEKLQTPVIVDAAPNLISKNPHLGSLISISEISGSSDRFLLLGGISGFLGEMRKAGITPGIETFTAMLEVIPPTKAAEKQIISMIRKIGLKADIDFFNILIKKRSMRFDYEGAKEVLFMIKTAKLQPDIVTYGVLALGCKTQEDARELLQEMKSKEIRMNIQILGAMLSQASFHRNFQYVHETMQIALEERIKPNAAFLKHLDKFYKYNKSLIENRHPSSRSKTFKHNFKNFENKLHIWQTEFGIENLKLEDAIKKIKEHPYRQLKEEEKKGFEGEKNEKLAKKRKIMKFIKKIKVSELKDDDSVTSTSH